MPPAHLIKGSTDQVKVSRFSAHGLIEIVMDGDFLQYSATGPFNDELFERFAIAQGSYLKALNHPTPWASIATFIGSAMFTPEAIQRYTILMRAPKPPGLTPVATAFVMAPDIEGAKIMAPHFRKIYRDINRPFEIFQTVEDAQKWARSMLDAHHVDAQPLP
jgi:hypothetical protein